MKFSIKIILAILVIQFTSSFILMYLGHYQYIAVLDMIIEKKERDTKYLVDNTFNKIKMEYIKYSIDILSNPEIINAFANRDRKKLQKLTFPIYEKLRTQNPYLNTMHFYTKDTHSFLRLHKLDEHGDNLCTSHPLILKVNQSKKFQTALKAEKYGFSYKTIFPVFKDGEHIGTFEFGVDIKYLMSKITSMNFFTPVFIATKEAIKPIYGYNKITNKYSSSFTNEYSFINFQSNTKNHISIKEIINDKIITQKSYIATKNSKKYLVFRAYNLKDYNENLIGYFIFVDDMDYYMKTIVFVRWISISITLLLAIIIVLLMSKLIRRYTFELRKQKNSFNYQAHHDALTGLPNRVLFNDRLNRAIVKSKRKNTNFALFFIDLDRFKHINDSLGHTIGDEVLKIISKRFKKIIRRNDTISRLGGDEFTVLAEDLREKTDASLLAKKLLDILSKPIIIKGHTLYISSSIGISLYPKDDTNADNLLKYADAAMYKAKDEGKNNFQYYSSDMTELAYQKVIMESSIRKALKDEEFVVYFQPQINAKTNKLVGMEALVRWQHSNGELIYPDKFIPIANETGLIIELDRWVMKESMKQVKLWYSQGLNPGVLALNLAMKQIHEYDFISIIEKMIKEIEYKPEWLEFEITEGEIMNKPENAIKVLQALNELGIKLAIDDFGTGYSSLLYLKQLPISKLKIDKSFVQDIPDNEEDVGITRAVIALSKSLRLSIIAEGVETKEQKDFLVENGCENIQGYFYARPMPATEMEKMLKDYS
ncbi:MAG: EAL domain-containing protein [Sulfurimonas sp.]|nr:EAL domain-containing protein [Sulfurimonas sp.]